MIAPMPTTAPLRRDRSNGVVAGVCAGIAKQTGLDVLLIRVIFIALAFAGGVGIAMYALLWAMIPAEGTDGRSFSIPQLRGRGAIEVGLGVGLLLLSLLLTLRALGVWWSVFCRRPPFGGLGGWGREVIPGRGVWVPPGPALWGGGAGPRAAPPAEAELEPADEPAAVASRMGIGAALVIASGFAFLWST